MTMGTLRVGDAFAYQSFDFRKIAEQPFFLRTILVNLRAQLHSRDWGLQIVRDRCQNLDPLIEVTGDAVAHRIKGRCSVGDLCWSGFFKSAGISAGVQRCRRFSEPEEWADR